VTIQKTVLNSKNGVELVIIERRTAPERFELVTPQRPKPYRYRNRIVAEAAFALEAERLSFGGDIW
jgi:hypothetical protein